jgi:hypothetical protein
MCPLAERMEHQIPAIQAKAPINQGDFPLTGNEMTASDGDNAMNPMRGRLSLLRSTRNPPKSNHVN